MHDWKKKYWKAPSKSEAGRDKADSCKADWMKKYYFCKARAYKDPQYPTYLKLSLKLNKID